MGCEAKTSWVRGRGQASGMGGALRAWLRERPAGGRGSEVGRGCEAEWSATEAKRRSQANPRRQSADDSGRVNSFAAPTQGVALGYHIAPRWGFRSRCGGCGSSHLPRLPSASEVPRGCAVPQARQASAHATCWLAGSVPRLGERWLTISANGVVCCGGLCRDTQLLPARSGINGRR